MTGGTESQTESTEGRPTSRVGVALWGSLVRGSTAWADVLRRVDGGEPERGDVPGRVLVTLMTAGLVTALWVIAGDALGRVFEDAITSVQP
jgi:hypothetical protein